VTVPAPSLRETPAAPPGESSAGGRRRRKSGPQPFDFRRPSKFSRDHARALQIVHETFARQFTTILSTTLRSVSQVTVNTVDHVSYDEYVRSSPELAFLALLNIDPLPGAGILQIRWTSAWRRSTGCSGGRRRRAADRALTDIESSLLRELVQRVCASSTTPSSRWSRLDEHRASSSRTRSSRRSPRPRTWWSRRRTTCGSAPGVHRDAVHPFASLQPISRTSRQRALRRPQGADPVESARAGRGRAHRRPGRRQRALRRRTLTSSQISTCRSGDVLPLRHPVSAPLSVVAAGRTCAAAVPGSKAVDSPS
jgi:flagellar motor switch protein FliM